MYKLPFSLLTTLALAVIVLPGQSAKCETCPSVAGYWIGSRDAISITQNGCTISGTVNNTDAFHSISGVWSTSGYFEIVIKRTSVKKPSCTTLINANLTLTGQSSMHIKEYATDGICDLPAVYDHESDWAIGQD
jgi:hypothetical protein